MTTIYKNAGVELYIDEADAYTPEEIRAHYSQFDKTLLQATYTVTKGEGETPTVVEFAKKTGTKGGAIPAPAAPPPIEPGDLLCPACEIVFMKWRGDILTCPVCHIIAIFPPPAPVPVIAALLALPPAVAEAEARALLDSETTEVIEIDPVVKAADKLSYRSCEAIERCLHLTPVHSPRPPIGF